MTRFYVRKAVGIPENVAALAVALGVGGLTFYLARMLLAREGMETQAPPRVAREPGNLEGATSREIGS